jgi:hypothetical protein
MEMVMHLLRKFDMVWLIGNQISRGFMKGANAHSANRIAEK